MANYQVVTTSSHADKRWRKYTDFLHARQDAVAPLLLHEFPAAAKELPLGFIAAEGAFVPVAVQGLQPGKNLLVTPDGRWVGGYVPARYRGYPFMLANTQDGSHVLCVDEDSGLLTQDGDAEAFFDENGAPAPSIRKVLDFLSAIASKQQLTEKVCAVLQKHELIQPWPIKVSSSSGAVDIGGLFRIDEARLNALPLEALDEVRQLGALPVIYLQLLSMQNLKLLSRLAEIFPAADASSSSIPDELVFDRLNDSGNISFEGL